MEKNSDSKLCSAPQTKEFMEISQLRSFWCPLALPRVLREPLGIYVYAYFFFFLRNTNAQGKLHQARAQAES